MYSSNGQMGKAKPARASSLANTGSNDTGSRASPVSRVADNKGSKTRQMSPPRMSESVTRSGSSEASGWTSMDEEHRKQNGRPVTWVGGGGLDIKWLSNLGVPRLRAIFLDVFGHHTASNNGAWLRRKLAEPAEGGRGRAAQIRARDASAAIWTTGRVKGVSKAEVSAIVAERQAERRQSRDRSISNDRGGRSARSHANSLSSGSLTPSRPRPPQAAAARVTNLFAEELPSEKRMYATRASQPVSRDRTLFGIPTQQPGLERLVMKKTDLRNKHAMRGLAVELLWQEDGQWWPATITQIDSGSVSVLYENGDSEELATHDVIRDGLLSLGWLDPQRSLPADSDNQLSSGAASAAGSATADARYLASSQEPDEELQSLLSYEQVCQNAIPDLKGDMDVLEPPCKKPKLETPPLDLLSSPPFRISPPSADSHMSTPSALLLPPSAGANTPMDAATCDWADNLLATAHRPTPTARGDPKLTSVSSLKPRAESKPSPVAFRLGNPGSSGFLSPPNRVMASVSKGSQLSRLGCTSPAGGVTGTPARGCNNPFASPGIGVQGAVKQPLPQGFSAHPQGSNNVPLPQKIRGIPMQPLKPQSAPASSSLGLQSPSFRTRTGPGAAPRMHGQGIAKQPGLQGLSTSHLSRDILSSTVSLVSAPSTLLPPAGSKQQTTVTTGMFHGLGSRRPPHSIPQSLFPKTIHSAVSAGSAPTAGIADVAGMAGTAATAGSLPDSGFLAGTASLPDSGFLAGTASLPASKIGPTSAGLGASVFSVPASMQHMAKSIMALPTGVVPTPHAPHMPSSAASFMDSVAAFTEGFALTHNEPGALGEPWTMGSKSDLQGNAFAKDAFEIIQLESGIHLDISDESSEQMWKIPAEMLVSDTDDLLY